jgi:membrane protease subunit (stomatin/prohibitin family)
MTMFIVFYKNNFDISRIGSNSFSEIPNSMALSFHDIPIHNISAKAFDFRKNLTQKLDINFINCGLSETSL